MEIWKDIKDFEDIYEISNLIRVRSKITGKILKSRIDYHGYLTVTLTKNKKCHTRFLHRLFAIAYVDNPNNYTIVNHLNGKKLDIRIDNLEWTDRIGNNHHAVETGLMTVVGEGNGYAKLNNDQVLQIRKLNGTMPQWKIGKLFGVSQGMVSMIINNKNWTHL